MIAPFVFESEPVRVVFGRGTFGRIAEEVAALGIERAFVLSTPEQRAQAEAVSGVLGRRAAGSFSGATMHTPVAVTERALQEAYAVGADGIVSIGGGSTIGLGKAIALRTDWPQAVIATTYAGSEMTPILGETAEGRKVTQRDPRVRPETVIYDVDLTLTLPLRMTAASGMNAIAHAVEAMYAQNGNPVLSLMAEEALRALGRALPTLAADPQDVDARTLALYGSWLCGCCLGAAGMAMHHKLCHTLGGMFDLPHAETHAIVLPHVVAYNAEAVPAVMNRMAAALGAPDAVDAIGALAASLPLPRGLRDIGMPEDGIDRAADAAVQSPYWNPRPVERAAVGELIARAWVGSPPMRAYSAA